jgi:hypothetical protein
MTTKRIRQILMDLEHCDVETAADGDEAPPNGAIPVFRRGGPRDGDLMGYASAFINLDESCTVLLHGDEPHPEAVEGCPACAGLWDVEP